MKFPLSRMLSHVPDPHVNNLVLAHQQDLLYIPVNHAGPELVHTLTRGGYIRARNIYAGCQTPDTLQTALERDKRSRIQAQILLNPHLPWDHTASQALEHLPAKTLYSALRYDGWMNPHLYDGSRPDLTARITQLPRLNTTLRWIIIRSPAGWGVARPNHLKNAVRDVITAPLETTSQKTMLELVSPVRDATARLDPGSVKWHTDMSDCSPSWVQTTNTLGNPVSASLLSKTAWRTLGANREAWTLVTQMVDTWDDSLNALYETTLALS